MIEETTLEAAQAGFDAVLAKLEFQGLDFASLVFCGGFTPLILVAVRVRQPEVADYVVDQLVQRGCSDGLGAVPFSFVSPLLAAVHCHNAAAAGALLKAGGGAVHYSVLHIAALYSAQVLGTLLDGGADVGTRAADGGTLLHTAVCLPNFCDEGEAVVQLLLDCGLNPLAVDNSGQQPLERHHGLLSTGGCDDNSQAAAYYLRCWLQQVRLKGEQLGVSSASRVHVFVAVYCVCPCSEPVS